MEESIESAIMENLEYDEETGRILWKNNVSSRARKGNEAGSIRKDGYIRVKISGKRIGAHRIIWFLHYGEWPEKEIDHIDGNPCNNRIYNLRDVTNRRNACNRKEHRAGRLVGVIFRKNNLKNPWEAYISGNKKQIHLGYFPTKNEAHLAYMKAYEAWEGEKYD